MITYLLMVPLGALGALYFKMYRERGWRLNLFFYVTLQEPGEGGTHELGSIGVDGNIDDWVALGANTLKLAVTKFAEKYKEAKDGKV